MTRWLCAFWARAACKMIPDAQSPQHQHPQIYRYRLYDLIRVIAVMMEGIRKEEARSSKLQF